MRRPRRISVVGATGTGKTHLAARVATSLGIEHVELDALHWGPGWDAAGDDLFRERTAAAVGRDTWVVDGNYQVVREIVWERADTVVWLNYAFPVMFRRLLSRTARRAITKEPLWNANTESWRTLFTRDSIIAWQLKTYRRKRVEYPERFADPRWAHIRFVTLRSPADAEKWLEALGPSA